MATCNQRYQISAQRKKDNARTRGLEQRPHARGWVNRVTIVTPRKPNSAKRPVVKVFLRRGGRLTAHIPGIGHSLKKFSKILLRGRGPRDLPGVRYSGVRGVLDFLGLKKKKRRRSIYGAEQNNISKIRARRKYRVAIRVAERENNRKKDNEILLEEEAAVNLAIKTFLIKKRFNEKILFSNTQRNFFFFKNPISAIEKRNVHSYKNILLNIYSTFLNIFNMYNIFSFFFIFLFNKNFIYKNKLFFKNAFFLKIIWPVVGVVALSGFTFKYFVFKNYLSFFFKTSFKFYLFGAEVYYRVYSAFFLQKKRKIRKVLLRKQFFFFLVSITKKKVKSIFLKKLSANTSGIQKDYQLLSNLDFFLYINQKLLFKKIATTFYRNNLDFLFDSFVPQNNLLLQANCSTTKFFLAKKINFANKLLVKQSTKYKRFIFKKSKFTFL